MKHAMPELPYALEALAPKMSAETFEYHYGKHLQTYVDNLNRLIAGTPFEEIPADWTCPLCGLYKDAFRAIEE